MLLAALHSSGGISQTSPLISLQRAPQASPRLVAVRMANSKSRAELPVAPEAPP